VAVHVWLGTFNMVEEAHEILEMEEEATLS
jgi:hypothetical protein